MAKKKEKDNIIRYRRPISFNVGILVFAFVLIYFVVYVIQYATQTHISVYEVQKGQIMVNSQYTGLVLRSETVSYAGASGSINYYSKEGDKAGYGDLICSIDSEGSVSSEITAAGLDGSALRRDDLLEIQDLITDYTYDYSEDQFYNIYSFKENINSVVQENLYLTALESLSEQTSPGSFTLVNAGRDGILAFYTDGFESVTPESFTADMYDPSGYSKTNLKKNTTVSNGEPIYKTITDENWYMMIPLDDDSASYYGKQLGDDGTMIIPVTFKKDEASCNATGSLVTKGSRTFMELAFNSSMIRYVSDRYLEVELGSDNDTGLKIPNSSIVEKDFYEVPGEYITSGNNSTGKGVLKITVDKDGEDSAEYVSADIYFTDENDGEFYIAGEDLTEGDVIQKPDSTDRMTLAATKTREGVYNVNKGYAIFKLIEPLTSNGEYTIVETGTSFGISLYDRIALDGSSMEEGDFIN
ncbi:MAG: hypothetical protein LUC41_01980 [Clostridiales bacterium]|nr:hypothetical protein [Clostridiales bacterium]